MKIVLSLMTLFLASPAMAQAPGGYAGQQARDIKALSAPEQADLVAGRGMGLARAGELNHHPGPAHVLELRDKLGLTPYQLATVQASFRSMEAAAKPLGADLVALERDLDARFQQGTMNAAVLGSKIKAIGVLQGRLRAVHLAAHVQMRATLSPAQIAAYDMHRGYTGDGMPGPAHGHQRQPG